MMIPRLPAGDICGDGDGTKVYYVFVIRSHCFHPIHLINDRMKRIVVNRGRDLRRPLSEGE
jgi:hypothetical protein